MPYKDPEKQKEWQRKNIKSIRASQKRWVSRNKEKIRISNGSIPLAEHLAKVTKPLKDWGDPSLPAKVRARRNTIRAVKRGKIIKSDHCESCKKKLPARAIHAHHLDYDDWTKIQWLCRSCHLFAHNGCFQCNGTGVSHSISNLI